jgi:glyceraldehyde 3-phosphate dehydrogenase
MSARIGINGFGRVGRNYLRVALERGLEVVAVNDVSDPATLAHLLRFDSTYGRLDRAVSVTDGGFEVDGRLIAVTAHREPADLDWGELGVDVVIESTGRFRERDDAALHLKAGAKKVLISAPGKHADLTVVMGVNESDYRTDRHDVISNASCTTNCVAPVLKVLDSAFGIDKAFLTTIHGYTNDQVLLDSPHKDLRRARSAAANIIPTSTGAARTAELVLPKLAGRLDGVAIRVPVEDGSLTDLAVLVDADVTTEQVNEALRHAAEGSMAGVLRYSTDPLVSRDVVGDPSSAIIDSLLTQTRDDLVKVFAWYDNEWGYVSRLVDLTTYVGERL